MADIDSILAGTGGNTRADFSAIGDLPKAYWEGKDQKAKNDLREAFKEGVPLTPDGQPDFGAMAKTLFQKGGLSEGTAAANLGLAQQNMQFGQGQSRSIQDFDRGGQTSQQPIVSPPSANRTASAVVAPPLNKGGAQAPGQAPQGGPQGDQPGSIVGLLSAAGISDEMQGPYINQLSAKFKTDPNATLSPEMSARVQEVIQAAAQRLKGGQQPQPSGLTPQPAQAGPQVAQAPPQQMAQVPQPPQMAGQPAPVTNALTTTQPSAEPSRAEKGIAFFSGIMADPRTSKPNLELAKSRLEALQKSNELTNDQKNYVQYKLEGGKGTMEDWLNRADDNTTQRDILNKSTIPRLEKSQETATAARDDIDAIHRARNELDQKGGVFSGAAADKKLYLAKAAELLGIPNADKIQNTESYSAAIGQRVAVMVKAFGSGTAISDGDRRFAAAMAGGQVTLEEGSMRRILDIAEKANRGKINYHNQNVDQAVKTNEGLKPSRDSYLVKAPGEYKKPDLAAAAFSSARDAIAKGAPRDAVMKRLKENGHDPAGL